jgi:hypothetical protein
MLLFIQNKNSFGTNTIYINRFWNAFKPLTSSPCEFSAQANIDVKRNIKQKVDILSFIIRKKVIF